MIKKLLQLSVLFFIYLTAYAEPIQKPLGIHLEGYNYPYPVSYKELHIDGETVRMAYMDVLPTDNDIHKTVVLLHGGLAFGAYWKDTIRFLSDRGYRVIVPDQVGFGKSSKKNLHLSVHLLAKNTRELLDEKGISKAVFIGHSFGGMLAVRFALMYPDRVTQLVLEDPLGLEDYRLKIPYHSSDEIFTLHPTWESILKMHQALYANWDKKYEEYAEVAFRVSLNSEFSKVAWLQAYTYEMIFSEPVLYEIEKLTLPVLFVFGEKDRTAPGKGFASPEMQKTLGNFPELVKAAVSKIKNAEAIEFENVGHVPHLEQTKKFNDEVFIFLKN